ncbi:MAG: hypothetical protein A2Y25_03885 [Candidatus Melainabacteria bacterium GWF2_37_15]|nr:MAG: hypothetical protein A2Y25_03885 [Candidatus Melainabacteria bacterium GWF2_37_15]
MEIKDIIYSLFFFLIAGVLLVSALGVVFLHRIVYSAVAMILAFLSVAGIFVLLNADFVAVSQIIIYAVGITIVMIFAIMLTGTREDKELWIAKKFRSIVALGSAGLLFLTIIVSSILATFALQQPSDEVIQRLQTEGTTSTIGNALLTTYVLPFEVLSLLLLAAIIGAVVIAIKNKESKSQ